MAFLMLRNFLMFYVLSHWQFKRKVVYTMLISNKCAAFHLWLKEILVKRLNISKYYANGFLQNIAVYVFINNTNCHKQSNLARIYFIFSEKYKNVLKLTWKALNTKIPIQWKDRKRYHQVRQNLAHFCNSIVLILC